MQVSHVKSNEVLLQVQGLKKHFGKLKVLDGIDIDIHKGEVVQSLDLPALGKVHSSAVSIVWKSLLTAK